MRVIDNATMIRKLIKNHKTIFIAGHKEQDLDVIGSAYGLYHIAKKYKKDAYVITDDINHELGVRKIMGEHPDIPIIKSNEVNNYKSKSNLLIITDTNKQNLIPNESLLEDFTDIITIDHHQESDTTINRGLKVIDENASSASEMIVELIYHEKIKIPSKIATILLAGIVLDTNNFILKTSSKTYFAAYFLTSIGASPKQVQYYLKQNIKDYINRQKMITDVEIIDSKYAINYSREDTIYRKEELAKIADTLLQFSGIRASFVVGKISDKIIGISARSDGDFNVAKIMSTFGGGGSVHEAAAKVENGNTKVISQSIKKILQEE